MKYELDLDPTQMEKLEKLAKMQGVPVSKLVAAAISTYANVVDDALTAYNNEMWRTGDWARVFEMQGVAPPPHCS